MADTPYCLMYAKNFALPSEPLAEIVSRNVLILFPHPVGNLYYIYKKPNKQFKHQEYHLIKCLIIPSQIMSKNTTSNTV